MTSAVVDVLLPVFNSAATIGLAVQSLLRQTLVDINVIAIDDGSTDSSPQILAQFARADRRVRIVTQNNRGIVDALNSGLGQSDSEFVARQDADDISEKSRLQLELDYLRCQPTCIAVSGAVAHIDGNGRPLGNIQRFPQPKICDPRWAPSREPYLMHPFVMIRRADLVSVGGYRHVFHSEDTDLYWRLLQRGNLHNLDAVVGFYRMHAQSISSESVINGRIMAFNSQLAALSAIRQRENRTDLQFEASAIFEYRRALTMAKMYELAARQLGTEYELRYLRIAVAGKMLELTSYRPYELDIDDCRFIRGARTDMEILPLSNRRQLDRLYAAASARLLRKEMFAEAVALTPPALFPSAIGRLVAKSLLSDRLTQHIRRL
jgi:glycosyltransferase involved in cell wall biosynthesis